MEQTRIIQSVKRYMLQLQKETEGAKVVENFNKVYFYLTDKFIHELDQEVWVTLLFQVVRETLIKCSKLGVRFKEQSSDWDYNAVKESYRLLELVTNCLDRGDTEALKVNLHKFYELLTHEVADAPTILYMWSCFNKNAYGYNVLRLKKEQYQQFLKATNDDELKAILSQLQENEKKAIQPAHTSATTSAEINTNEEEEVENGEDKVWLKEWTSRLCSCNDKELFANLKKDFQDELNERRPNLTRKLEEEADALPTKATRYLAFSVWKSPTPKTPLPPQAKKSEGNSEEVDEEFGKIEIATVF